MKYLIYELFSGVGLCNQIFSFETSIYLSNILDRKLILLIKNPLCHCGKSSWDYGYFLNFFTNEYLEYLPYGLEVYYKNIPIEIINIISDPKKTKKINFCDRFSNIVFVDKHLDVKKNEKDIQEFCNSRKKVIFDSKIWNNDTHIFINQSNASRLFYNFYTIPENYILMNEISKSLVFKSIFYDISDKIYQKISLNLYNEYIISVHVRFGDYQKDVSFLERFNKNMITNLTDYFDGHKTNLIFPKILFLVDNKNNSKFFSSMKKYSIQFIDEITKNYLQNYFKQNKMLFNDFIIPKNYDVANAILDMIIASKTNEFIGTSTSTFSNYIQYLRYRKNKSFYNYCNINQKNFKLCRFQKIKNSNYDWIKYHYRGGHPISWHIFWNPILNHNIQHHKKVLMTIHGKTDGFGSQLQACFSLIAYCTYKNYEYIHTPMYSMHHNDENKSNFPEYMNNFINLEKCFRSKEKLSNFEISQLHETKEGPFVHGSYYPDFFYNQSVLKILRECYYSSPKPNLIFFSSNKKKKNIAIHIRRGDVNQKKYPSRYTSNINYINILKKLNICNNEYTFHIFSQGSPNDFKEIIDTFPCIQFKLHLDENIQLTFHSLVKCDILILAKSSFSYCAALLNENRIIDNFIKSWWHKPLKKWEIIE